MRKLAAIFFLSLFLVYHVGYIGFYWLSVKQIARQWQAQAEYHEGALKKIAIPVALPYMPDQPEYRATHGTITIDGKIYRKVMHKYVQNTIHLLVAEDHLSENLNQSFEDWINSMTGTQNNSSEKSTLLKSLIKSYFAPGNHLALTPEISTSGENHFYYLAKSYSLALDIDTPPPQA